MPIIEKWQKTFCKTDLSKFFLPYGVTVTKVLLKDGMRRIFVNTALEALRKNDLLRNGVELNALEPQQEADYSAVEKISADELMELIAQLPPGFRTVFNMFAIEGYSHREIAETLNINESTSRSQYTRAKRLLQKWIKELK